MPGRVSVALGLAVLAAVASMGAAPAPRTGEGTLRGDLRRLVAERRYGVGHGAAPGLRFSAAPEVAELGTGGERRRAVVTGAGPWWWRGRVPAHARLATVVQAVPDGGAAVSRLVVTVTAVRPLERRVLSRVVGSGGWLPVVADLSSLAGESVELELRAEAHFRDDESGRPRSAARIAWASFRIAGGVPAGETRPNIVLVVVDTLRADRLGAYGSRRPTSPNVDALLARRGVVVERAYAPAPWTLPSMIALLSSRWPGELVDADPATHRLPATIPTLASALQGLGYETAGLVANGVLHDGNGFGRGFDTFYSPEDVETGMVTENAERLTALTRRWLAVNQASPFFLWAHYIDPHDPYENPDVAGGRSPFYPEYRGRVTGSFVHGIFLGRIPLLRPVNDVRQINALYDSEVVFFDRFLARLLAAFDPPTLRRTLFVLTADHGEELFDHGGWKHGRTLYEEQLRVPLVVRWDGVLPAGSRVSGPARLLDLAPTLVAAAGGEPPPQWQGRNLLPMLRGEERPVATHAYARHLTDGPLRASVAVRDRKLILYDRYGPFTPPNGYAKLFYAQDRARLDRIELYDLSRDPGEKVNLAAAEPEQVRRLAPLVHEHLGRELPGLRVLLAGAPAGTTAEVTIRFRQAPAGWESYFLAETDRATLDGNVLTLALHGEALAKGVLVAGDPLDVESVQVSGVPSLRVRLGSGRPLAGGGAPAAALRREGWPGAEGPTLLLWRPAAPRVAPAEADPETRRRLEALGYAG